MINAADAQKIAAANKAPQIQSYLDHIEACIREAAGQGETAILRVFSDFPPGLRKPSETDVSAIAKVIRREGFNVTANGGSISVSWTHAS